VFSWGLARDYVLSNPAKGVERNEEKARKRYVTNAEYQALYAEAPAHVQAAMELAYMCRAGLIEVLMLTRDSILEEGLYLKGVKGSKDAVITWTPRLRATIDAAKALPKYNEINRHVFQSKYGTRMRESIIQSAWQRIKSKPTFTIHDLKAKGVSDFEGDKVAAGGWKDAKMVNTYDRKVTRIGPTE
jgi:site-specific recombinase XerC